MTKIEIKHRYTNAILFSHEAEGNAVAITLKLAIVSGSNLRGSNLSGSNLRDSNLSDSDLRGSNLRDSNLSDSDLRGSNLRDSNLRDSNLSDSDLRGSNLRGSNLSGSNLRDSDLRGSNLRDSDLRGSNLRDSNLRDSDLRGSNLRDSNLRDSNLSDSDLRGSNLRDSNLRDSDLRGSDLRGSDLTPIRDDLWAVLSAAPREVTGLIDALKTGRVDGSTYQGECACLVGTIANTRTVHYEKLGVLQPNSSRPIERFFIAIRKDDTPETSQFSALAVEWAEQWLDLQRSAFYPKYERIIAKAE